MKNILAGFVLAASIVVGIFGAGSARAEGGAAAPVSAPAALALPAPIAPSPIQTLAPLGKAPSLLPAAATAPTSGALLQPTPGTAAGTEAPSQPGNVPAKTAESPVPLPTLGESAELSAIEKATIGADGQSQKATPQNFQVGGIRQFGYDFFRPQVGFAPLTDVPVGPDYVIGPGDTIILSTWGSLEGSFPLEVNRSGEVILPRVGTIKVWGMKFGDLPKTFSDHLKGVYKDFQLSVTMGKLRTIKVYVVGMVRSPGDYTLSSLSTIINALAVAGGPSKDGSLRAIQLKRGSGTVQTIDLYDFFLQGDKSRDVRLQPGDTIFVPAIGRIAGVAGNVRRPAIYELKEEKTLKELLALAEGMLPTGYLQRVQISRVDAHERKITADFNLDPRQTGKSLEEQTAAIPIRDLDLVKIFPIDQTPRDQVRLEGYVLRPGEYAFKPGMRLSSILTPDILLPEYHRTIGHLTRFVPPDQHPETIIFNPSRALAREQGYDLELQEFDTVRIYNRWELEQKPTVRIGGEVQRPGTYGLTQNMTLLDLLLAAGNVKLTAYLKNAEINRLRHSGEAVQGISLTIDLGKALQGDPQHNLLLEPFDELTVRRIPNWSEETERYVTLSGEFVFPGTYPLYRGERLSSLIARAGGFTDKAYLRGSRFTREAVRRIQQQRMDEALSRVQEEILKKQVLVTTAAASKEELDATRASLEGLERTVQFLKTKKAEGRMVLRIEPLDKLKGSPDDIELAGGDTLVVPNDSMSVNILGTVYNPTTALYKPKRDISYYLDLAGGATQEADESEMYLVKADGTVFSARQASSFLFYNTFLYQPVDSGDTLIVPQRFEKTAWMRDIKDIAAILGNIALVAGVLIAAGL